MDNELQTVFTNGDMSWSIAQIWYESLLTAKDERKMEPRERLWASELGKSPIDIYLKLKGVPYSNPYSPRSLMKFEAGNIWEGILGLVLKRAGILKSSQDWVKFQYPGMLPVTGKLDFLAGGNIDWDKAKESVLQLKEEAGELPGFSSVLKVAEDIVDKFSKMFPDGMREVVYEIKSSSSFQFDRRIALGGIADPEHKIQAFHYLKATNRPEAHVLYVCKDDSRLLEVGVLNPSPVEEDYKQSIKIISDYYYSNTMPEKEAEIEFNTESMKFRANWKVQYSPYLTHLYGYENQTVFQNKYQKMIASWNRTLTRCVDGANMTKLNLEVVGEIKNIFPNFDSLVSQVRSSGVTGESEDSDA